MIVVNTLNLPAYVGQRSATFRFGLINAVTGEVLADLHPLSDPPAKITHDTSRTIKRQLTLSLGVEDSERINVVQSRVIPYMVIDGVEYPLGRYIFAGDTRFEFSSGSLGGEVLLDEMHVIDQQIESAISPNTSLGYVGITELIKKIITPFNVDYEIEPTNYTTNGSWPIGTNRGNVLENLALEGGYFSPWFNNTGVLKFNVAVDPAAQLATFDWDTNHVVYRSSMSRTSDLLTAPNRFIVISNGTSSQDLSGAAIVGTYDVPDSAPWSAANRGFVVPRVIELGVDTRVQAQVIATTLGQRQLVFEYYSLDTAPDPRHDSYDVITWQGEKWLELAWSLTCREGEPMSHVLRRAFS